MKFTLLKEFKEFAVRGNMIDIAIGVIIGASFNKVVDVLVKEVFLPPLALLTDGINYEDKRIILREAKVGAEGASSIDEIAIGYGKLIESGLDFLIVGFSVFIVVKFMNSIRNKAEDPKNVEESTPKNIELLSKMTDLLEKQVGLLENLDSKRKS